MMLIYALAFVALLSVEGFGFLFFIAVIPYTALVMLANVIAVIKARRYFYPSIPFLGKK